MAKRMEPLALLLAGALVAAAGLQAIAPARAQPQGGGDGISRLLNSLFSGSKVSMPAAAGGANGAVASGSIPWSGQDGASGDPLMTAAAIRQAAANFDTCIASLWPEAARRHINRENFERFTAGLSPDLHIMDLLDAQPEFTKPIWDYLDILVNDDRLAMGREILAKYKPQFDATERAYGVDRYTIAAIWGIESN
jgi:membrane-bound lytic murein transglycosylase B